MWNFGKSLLPVDSTALAGFSAVGEKQSEKKYKRHIIQKKLNYPKQNIVIIPLFKKAEPIVFCCTAQNLPGILSVA